MATTTKIQTFTVSAYFNETSRFDPYTKGDTLTRSARGFWDVTVEPGALGHIAAANAVYRAMNLDERRGTDWEHERSLSVGDVVQVEWYAFDEGRVVCKRLAVENFGFREV